MARGRGAPAGEDAGRAARHLRIRGRVQGVFFRASTREEAERRGVAGWVANTPEGDVEAWLEGPPEAVDAMVEWVRGGGPPHAEVTELDLEEVDPARYEGFEVRG
jgi:acylphosphatase